MSDTTIEVVICPACGTKNRIRHDLPLAAFRCGACQTPLAHSPRRGSLARAFADMPELALRILRGAVAICVFAIPAWVSYIAIFSEAPKIATPSQSHTTPRPLPILKPAPPPFLQLELRLPENGEVVRYTNSPTAAPFEIKSDYGTNYLVKLTTASDDMPIQTIFVRGGSSVSVKVPLGTFNVKYASGQKWYCKLPLA